jgi:hypothetical protein
MVVEWEVAMPGSANECEAYARDCVRLAEHPNAPPEVRDRLLEMARMWMEAAMDEEKRGAGFMPPSPSFVSYSSMSCTISAISANDIALSSLVASLSNGTIRP